MPKHRRPQISRARRWRSGALVLIAAICATVGFRVVPSMIGGGARAHAAPIPGGAFVPAKAAGTGPTHSPTPTRQRHVSGRSVTAIGDSVLVASTPALDKALPGIGIDAMVGRQFSTGLQVLAALKESGQLRPIVVFALGTNGTVTPDEIRELFALIGPSRRLVLVNTFEARSWEQEVNSTLSAAARHRANVVLANWFATIEHRTYLLWPDGIHPQPAGGVVYARMLKKAVEQAANLPS